jgi:hypothetical protein
MPRSATRWLPKAWPEGPREAGIGQRRGCPTALKYTWGANSPLRGRIFLWKRLLRPSRSRPILPQPRWDGTLRAVCLVRLLAKERPRAQPEGPRKAGIGQRRGCFDRALVLLGPQASRYGVVSSSGRDCSALRGRTICVVAFRASHPAKPPSRQRRLVQGFPNSSREPASEPYRTSGVRSPPSKPFKRRRDHPPIPLNPALEMCPPFPIFPGFNHYLHPSHLRSAILPSAFNPAAARLESHPPNGATSSATRPG